MKGISEITVDETIVRVIRKNIKNIYLRIGRDGKPFVSAPIMLPDTFIEKFVLSKKEWLKNALAASQERQEKMPSYCEGEIHTFLGGKYTLHIDTDKKKGYYFKGNDIVLCVGENSTAQARKKALANVYRDALCEILPEWTEECQNKSGLFASEWRVRDMKTRYGSCNTKTKRIWLSVWLIEKPIECIEAVIYHELAHLKVRGHNKEFYALLESICPNYRQAERKLKNNV